jgi:methylthioxylose transferase
MAVAAIAILLAPRLVVAADRPASFAARVLALALVLGLALNVARAGTRGWDAIFDVQPGGSFEAGNEYLPGLPALSYGTHFYLDRFSELVPSLPVNVAGHPPAPLLVLHGLGLTTAAGAAALCIGAAALCAPLTYALGRAVGSERDARVAAVLFACSPAALLFGVTSFDAVFATCGLAAAALLAAERGAARTAGAVVLAAASLLVIGWVRPAARRAWRTPRSSPLRRARTACRARRSGSCASCRRDRAARSGSTSARASPSRASARS